MSYEIDMMSQKIIDALGWALLHSLWQGAVVALLLGVLLLLLNRHSAKVRYFLSIGSTIAVFGFFIITFLFLYFDGKDAALETGIHSVSVVEVSTLPNGNAQNSFWGPMLLGGEQYFNQHLPLLVSLWMVGLLLMSLRFLGGLAYVQRLRHYRIKPLESQWQETLLRLQKQMGITKVVKLAESTLVKVPMVIGYLKPVILIPVGAATGLSQQQLKAILAHELAHIGRNDYLFNLLQHVIETILFFHPAVWWLSGIVRTEREHCCDDVAAAACGDTVTYVRALTQLEELHQSEGPSHALALSGKKGSLLYRIKRLVNKQSKHPSFREGFIVAIVVMSGLFMLSFGAWAGLGNTKQIATSSDTYLLQDEKIIAATSSEAEDVLLASALTLADTSGNESNLVIIKNKKGGIAELYVNGRRIPQAEVPDFQQLIEQQLREAQKFPRMRQGEKKELKSAIHKALSKDTVPESAEVTEPSIATATLASTQTKEASIVRTQEGIKTGRMLNGKGTTGASGRGINVISNHLQNKSLHTIRGTGAFHQISSVASAEQHSDEAASVASAKEQEIKGKATTPSIEQKLKTKYDNILNELQKDRLLEKEAEIYELHIDQDAMYINGTKQAQQYYGKYKKLLLGDSVEGLENYSITIKRNNDN